MNKKLYVGNLPYSANDHRLREIFQDCGEIESAKVIVDKYSGNSKGFGFVEMTTEEGAQKAISEINEKEIDGRKLKVNEAKPMEKRGNGGGRKNWDNGGRRGSSKNWW